MNCAVLRLVALDTLYHGVMVPTHVHVLSCQTHIFHYLYAMFVTYDASMATQWDRLGGTVQCIQCLLGLHLCLCTCASVWCIAVSLLLPDRPILNTRTGLQLSLALVMLGLTYSCFFLHWHEQPLMYVLACSGCNMFLSNCKILELTIWAMQHNVKQRICKAVTAARLGSDTAHTHQQARRVQFHCLAAYTVVHTSNTDTNAFNM